MPPNAFEPFHAMSRTVRSRLRELIKVQDEAMEVDGEKAKTMMKGVFRRRGVRWLLIRR